MITVKNQSDHTIYTEGNPCVEEYANNWLINGILPNGDIVDTGSLAPRAIPVPVPVPTPPSAMTVQPGDVTGAIRRGCDTQSYVVGPGQRVRVHRCY